MREKKERSSDIIYIKQSIIDWLMEET
jgi:hypothetical protein